MNSTRSHRPAPVTLTGVFEPGDLQDRLASAPVTVSHYRDVLEWGGLALEKAFADGVPAEDLVHGRAALIDEVLIRAWQNFLHSDTTPLALIAVGGYGRGELHPCSDIDVMVLHKYKLAASTGQNLERFLTFLWDIGLEIGHSVRTPDQCLSLAHSNVTVMTNLLEARWLFGSGKLLESVREKINKPWIWPTEAYFQAKMTEQEERYAKYQDTAHNLEPNVKESPGGLRDLHNIVWVAKRHFGAGTLHELVDYGFLTEAEHGELLEGRAFLWKVRFALHMAADRHEDRLLFDYQMQIAEMLGYEGSGNAAVESFMQDYYRAVQTLSCLNDMLLQLFQEAILYPGVEQTEVINRRFQARNGFMEARSDQVFRKQPFALLEIFHLMQMRQDLRGIRAQTLRMIRRDRELIGDEFRAAIRARTLFMEMLREPRGITHALRRMNRYGVLGRYLPVFGRIVGLMQYDLFHTLTVDEHILFVVRNMRRLMLPRNDRELPFASQLAQSLPKPELLYIAGLFHDVAKGRKGDHSQIGAREVEAFCSAHGLPSWDTRLVIWLVREHLLMSMTAQKRDLADQEVIQDFADHVGDQLHLDYLFVLTVCDIRATNPALWNSWRKSLLMELYDVTRRSLERGPNNPLQEHERIAEKQKEAGRILQETTHLDESDISRVWARLDDDYFLRNTAGEIAWHTPAIAAHMDNEAPLVLVRTLADRGTSVFIYTHDVDYLFGLTTAVLSRLGLNILDARIATTSDGYTLDSYVVMAENGQPVTNPDRHREIIGSLEDAITRPDSNRKVTRRTARRLRQFSIPTQVYFRQEFSNQRTVLELVTRDRPGLLSIVGALFRRYSILVHAAKIGTIGERVEDVFFITDTHLQPLTDSTTLHHLRRLLTRIFNTETR